VTSGTTGRAGDLPLAGTTVNNGNKYYNFATSSVVQDSTIGRVRIPTAQEMLDAIEGYGYRLCELLHDTPIESTEEAVKLGDQARAAYRWCNQTTERIVQIVHAHMGGADVFESSMIQRLLRDIQTSSQHVMPGDSAFVRLGRHRLGIDVRPGI